MAGDRLVGDERSGRTGSQRGNALTEPGEQAAADDDVIAARAQGDRHHGRVAGADRSGHDRRWSSG
jgi:hypothetical protein